MRPLDIKWHTATIRAPCGATAGWSQYCTLDPPIDILNFLAYYSSAVEMPDSEKRGADKRTQKRADMKTEWRGRGRAWGIGMWRGGVTFVGKCLPIIENASLIRRIGSVSTICGVFFEKGFHLVINISFFKINLYA